MVADQGRQLAERRRVVQKIGSLARMIAHLDPFGIGERPRLVQRFRGNRQLPDVMQPRRIDDERPFCAGQGAESVRHRAHELGNGVSMEGEMRVGQPQTFERGHPIERARITQTGFEYGTGLQ